VVSNFAERLEGWVVAKGWVDDVGCVRAAYAAQGEYEGE